MKNTLFNITRVLAVVVMIGALSLIGAKPKVLPFRSFLCRGVRDSLPAK